MKRTRQIAFLLSFSILFSGCASMNMNNTTKGGLIGGGGGAALGAIIGGIAGKGKGAAIGAAVGAAVGTGAGVVIGKKMDKAAKEAAQIEGAQVESVTDTNGLQAVKVTFDSGILFAFNSSQLSAQAQQSLADFSDVLLRNPTINITINGHTDKVGTMEANYKVSQARANAVYNFLKSRGIPHSQITDVLGHAYTQYDESLTPAQNRRVEVFMFASAEMIRQAEAGTL